MARADRLKAGASAISAGNMNKVIEQANRLDGLRGGPGIDAQSDATGVQVRNNRRRPVPDSDSPFGSSSPFRSTIKRRSDTTRHKGEWELYGSSGVSALARDVSSSIPQWYGIPFLPVTNVIGAEGDGDLVWGIMDADQYGTSGPRSLERRQSSSGDRFQIYDFDAPSSSLDSSEVTQTAVRRRYGSSGNHYVAWVNTSDVVLLDQTSLDRNDLREAQLFNWDFAVGVAPVGADLFPFKRVGNDLQYTSANQLLGWIEANIDIDSSTVPVDDDSINVAVDSGLIQLYDWNIAKPTTDNVTAEALVPIKRYNVGVVTDPASYFDDLAYMPISAVVEEAVSLDDESIDRSAGPEEVQLKSWDAAVRGAVVNDESLIAIKQHDGGGAFLPGNYADTLTYCSIGEALLGATNTFWVLGGTFATAYGNSIGINTSTSVIDLVNRQLQNGGWSVLEGDMTATDGDLIAEAISPSTGRVLADKKGRFGIEHAYEAEIGTSGYAGLFTDKVTNFDQVWLCDGTWAVLASGNVNVTSAFSYYHDGVQGWSGTFQVTQSGATKDVTVSGGIITDVA